MASSPFFKIFVGFCVLVAQLSSNGAADPSENLTETDDAEFRQGGIGQQLLAGYSGLYGNTAAAAGYPYMAAGSSGSGSYVNMLRNLYRPPNFGLTDKVKHWVKSFMNRRQYVKPYYTPGMQFNADEFGGKPMYVGGNSYKAISIPLRQLQKYYKPYYATGNDGASAAAAQFLQQQSPPRSVAGSGSAAANSMLSYSPGGSGGQLSAGSGGLYASESAGTGHFSGGGSLFGAGSDGSSALFGAGGSSSGGLFSGNPNLFASSDGGSSALFSAAGLSGSGLYGSGSNPGSNIFQGSSGGSGSNIFQGSSGGSGSNIFQGSSGGSGSNLFQGSSGGSGSNLYHGSAGGSGSSVFSLDGGSGGLYSSDGQFFGSSNGGSSYGSNAAASSLLSSLNAGANGGAYGDLYASGASPSATIYSPGAQDQARGYGGGNKQQQQQQQSSYGASSSALYMPSSDHRSADSYSVKPSQEPVNSFNVDSSRGNQQAEPSYSVSFQPAQGKSYSPSSSYDSAGFQPVSFSSEDGGYKGFQGKSS